MSQDMRYTCGHKAISSTPFSVHLTDINTSTSPEHDGHTNTLLVIPGPCFNCQDTPLTAKHEDETGTDLENPYSGEQLGILGSSPTFTLEDRVTTKCVWTKTSFDLRFLDCDDFFDVDLDPLPVEAVGLMGPPTMGRDICPASKGTPLQSSSSIGVDEFPGPDKTARATPTPDMTLPGKKTDEKPYWKTDKPSSKPTTRAKSPSFDSLKGGFYGVDIDHVPYGGGGVSKAALAETMLMLGRQLRDMNEPRDREEGFWTSLESHHVVGSPDQGVALETMVTTLTARISHLPGSLLRRSSVQDSCSGMLFHSKTPDTIPSPES